jgi:putative MATE family efflux protein
LFRNWQGNKRQPDQKKMTTVNPLTTSPILPTILRLSLPNMLAMLATTLVSIAETSYVGQLGTPALAGIALVFPMIMLMQMLSAGSMGGGISAAISRAIGAGDEAKANSLALHAFVISVFLGLLFTFLFLALGPQIYTMVGGTGESLNAALAYSNVAFAGILGIWLMNAFSSIIRASGNMKTPSVTLLLVAVGQVLLGGALGLGLGPFPRMGMSGVALGLALSYGAGTLFLFWYLWTAQGRLQLRFRTNLQKQHFGDILKVGAIASISSVQSVLTILILTRIVSGFGTEALAGYGIGARLEFLLVPITFAIGVACIPLVGMALGAGLIARARQVAWTGAALASAILGGVGLLVAFFPHIWTSLFTNNPTILAIAAEYFLWVGPCYCLFGLGLCLYFSSQAAGKLIAPVMAGTARLVIVAIGGWYLLRQAAPVGSLFALIGAAMIVYGVGTGLAVYRTRWDKR